MNAIIRPDTCSTCPHRVMLSGGKLECHAGPPTAHPVLAMTSQGPRLVDVISIFPPVEPEFHCGAHPRIAAKVRAGLLGEPITPPG